MQIQSIIYNTETTISIIATLTVASLVMMLTGVVCLLNLVHARHRKSKNLTTDLVLLICTTVVVLASSFLLAFNVNSRIHAPKASLASIENFITVEGDKVTIKSWSKDKDLKKFKYDVNLSRDSDQVFQLKADETYERYSLIDSRSKEHSISKEEYEMLKSKRHS